MLLLSRLRPTAILHNIQAQLLLSNRCLLKKSGVIHRLKATTASTEEEELDLDKPLKFSTSRAAQWKPRDTYGGRDQDHKKHLWYQPYVVSLSLITFLVYFCVLREENDTDKKLTRTLYDHIDGLEEMQLELALEHDTKAGHDTQHIKDRLKELSDMKNS